MNAHAHQSMNQTDTLNKNDFLQWGAMITCSIVVTVYCSSVFIRNPDLHTQMDSSKSSKRRYASWKVKRTTATSNDAHWSTNWQLTSEIIFSLCNWSLSLSNSLCAYNFTSLILTIYSLFEPLSFSPSTAVCSAWYHFNSRALFYGILFEIRQNSLPLSFSFALRIM